MKMASQVSLSLQTLSFSHPETHMPAEKSYAFLMQQYTVFPKQHSAAGMVAKSTHQSCPQTAPEAA